MELNIKNTFQLFRLYYSIVSCLPIYQACSSLVSRFILLKSFNYTHYLFSKKMKKRPYPEITTLLATAHKIILKMWPKTTLRIVFKKSCLLWQAP